MSGIYTLFSKNILIGTLALLSSCFSIFGQDEWAEYVKVKEKGIMSIGLDLSLSSVKPNYKNLVIVGKKYNNCMPNGFPDDSGLDELISFSDSTSLVIDGTTRNKLAGIITYQCMGFDVYYVKDTTGLRDNLEQVIKTHFDPASTYVNIKKDSSWEYYYTFLFPNDLSLDALIDHKYLNDLVLQGDDLSGLRKVNHWLYFKNLKNRNKAEKKLELLDFNLESISYIKTTSYPYELKISRRDSITPASINKVTNLLKALCYSLNANYDGWSTDLQEKSKTTD